MSNPTSPTTAETAAALEAATASLADWNAQVQHLRERLAQSREDATSARKERERLAYAAVHNENPTAREALGDWTAREQAATTEASNIELAIQEARRQREQAEIAKFAAASDHALAQAHEVAARILKVAENMDAKIAEVIDLMAARELMYAELRATGANVPATPETAMDERMLGWAMAAGIWKRYGSFVEQSQIFPSLRQWRDFARSMFKQDTDLCSRIERPNPEAARRKAQRTASPGSRTADDNVGFFRPPGSVVERPDFDPAEVEAVRSTYRDPALHSKVTRDEKVRRLDDGQGVAVYEVEVGHSGVPVRRYGSPTLPVEDEATLAEQRERQRRASDERDFGRTRTAQALEPRGSARGSGATITHEVELGDGAPTYKRSGG